MVAGDAEELADARLEVGQLLTELFLEFVDFGRGGEPVLEIQLVDQCKAAVRGAGRRRFLPGRRGIQRVEHLGDEPALDAGGLAVEFVHGGEEAAVLGDAAGLHRGRAELVAELAHHLVVDLEQGLVQQRDAGVAQLRMAVGRGQRGEFLPVACHAQLLQRPQGVGRLARERDADAQRAQALESRRHPEGLGGLRQRRGENDLDLGVGTPGERRNRRFRVGESQEQAAEAEVADFAGDLGMARLRDDRRLRYLESSVAPQFLGCLSSVRRLVDCFHTFSP